ncbi:MAG: hypothetical protein RLZZ584_1523 [Pseudomonadota bacterium]|jgi:hypothetical protein
MFKTRKLARAAMVAAGTLATPLFAQVCTAPVTPFTAGPIDPVSKFPQWVVDSNGVGLGICLDSVDGLGNPPPCFYDPVVPGNAFSAAIGRGNEAFYYLADNTFTTSGPAIVDAVIVMAMESAFLSPDPVDGQQTQFSRLRIRVNVNVPGIYTVDHPWGSKTYTVSTLLPAGNGQNRMEISDVTDISFNAGVASAGLVTPFLKWDPAVLPAATAGYLGDGATLHRVVGSPCGNNFVRITAKALDGVTRIAIDPGDTDGDGSTASYTSRLFTVMGKRVATGVTPLAVGNAYFTRSATTGTTITVMAQSSPTAAVTATPGGRLAGDGTGRFYVTTPFAGTTLPLTVAVTATDAANAATPNNQPALPLRDLVTITRADALCTAATRLCTLSVDAQSSDAVGNPALTLAHTATRLANGTITVTGATALPGSVTVTSAAGGSASKPVTVVNQ